MEKIKFGIIGYGSIGKRHWQRIEENEQTEIKAVCDIKEHELAQFKNTEIFTTTNYQDLLALDEVDVVCVTTPNYLHASITIDALNAKKHVVCEKPMALTVLDCNKMILAAQKNMKRLFVVKQNRFNPPVMKVKELLEQGKLGQVHFVVVNCFWNRNKNYYVNSDWKGKKN